MKTLAALGLSLIFLAPVICQADDKRIVMIAGQPSHGPGEHEYRAGLLLFQKCFAGFPGIKVEVYSNGWPSDLVVFKGAAAVVLYTDGGPGHPVLPDDHLQQLGALAKQGTGLACLHYACEPTIEKGQAEFIDWFGGCFEINRSVNPRWEANFKTLPDHPIVRGVKPFKMNDEWYFNLRFRDGLQGVKLILAAVPPPETMNRRDGPHEGNPAVRKAVADGESQAVAWAVERADGGRGFGFTGGHFHRNWGDDNFRKVVLNAILWVAKVEVPANGVNSTVTAADLLENLDKKAGRPKAKPTLLPTPAGK